MLRDICAEGASPRSLGRFGLVSSKQVEDVIAVFKVWMDEGCIHKPVHYKSQSHNHLYESIIVKAHPGGALDLMTAPIGHRPDVIKTRAAPNLVITRRVEDWFLPRGPAEEADLLGLTSPAAAAAASSETEASALIPPLQLNGSIEKRMRVKHYFNGPLELQSESEPYLILQQGDILLFERVDDVGWAWGRHTIGNEGPLEGWYPANYAEPI